MWGSVPGPCEGRGGGAVDISSSLSSLRVGVGHGETGVVRAHFWPVLGALVGP